MQQNPDSFNAAVTQYGIKTIIFAHTDQTPWAEQFVGWITKDQAWKIVYLDDTMMILTQSQTQIQYDDPTLIAKYRDSLPSLFRLAHFYNIAGWTKSYKAVLQEIVTLSPNNCPVLFNLTLLLEQTGDPTSIIYAQRHQMACR